MSKTLKGKFRPKNPEKYIGDPGNIVYRSSWERTCMNYFDLREDVQAWQSEEKWVSYYDPVTKKQRRYFPDFIIKYKRKDGVLVTRMIEVKPHREVVGPPKEPKRKTKSWVNQVKTYITNQAKWKAARNYCEDRGWEFQLVTENELGMT